MDIRVLYKRVWGKDRFYPVSQDAEALCLITGKPTLSRKQLKICLSTSWHVTIMQPEIDTRSFLGDDEDPISRDDMSVLRPESDQENIRAACPLPNFNLS